MSSKLRKSQSRYLENIILDELIKHLEFYGRIVMRKAYADWHRLHRDSAKNIHGNHFELIYVPHDQGIKNSVDIKISTDIINAIINFPNIKLFALIANDGDYRHISSNVMLRGKKFILIGDPNLTPTSVLEMVDEHIDVNKFITGNFDFSDEGVLDGEIIKDDQVLASKKSESLKMSENQNTKQFSKQRLEILLGKLLDACRMVAEEKKQETVLVNSVLTKLKAMIPNIDEQIKANSTLAMTASQKRRWYLSFLEYANDEQLIELEFKNNNYFVKSLKFNQETISNYKQLFLDYAIEIIKNNHEYGVISLSKFAALLNEGFKKKMISVTYKELGFKSMNEVVNALKPYIKFEMENIDKGNSNIVLAREEYKH
jgi:hypothetical protein